MTETTPYSYPPAPGAGEPREYIATPVSPANPIVTGATVAAERPPRSRRGWLIAGVATASLVSLLMIGGAGFASGVAVASFSNPGVAGVPGEGFTPPDGGFPGGGPGGRPGTDSGTGSGTDTGSTGTGTTG